MRGDENLFHNVLASFQARRGWTQEDAAAHIGVSRHTYSDWITGKNIPTPKQLIKIAAGFKLNQADEDLLYSTAASTSPKIHNLPFPQNPFFTGRNMYLEQLHRLFQENGSVALTQSISVSGLGGIGKTQLALEYAHRCFPHVYRAVFWVSAADRASLEASYDSLAQLLELPEREDREQIHAVMQWLEAHTNWLLIMDNADDLLLARSFFPTAHHGRILLTSRSQIVGNTVARQIEIDKMTPDEGMLFLLRRTRMLEAGGIPEAVAPAIREAALQVVELLGGHPLALDQAGAYIEGGVSFTDYIDHYRQERRRLLDERGSLGGEHSDHPESVVVTFELCFNKARERHPVAIDILRFCAFLHPDDIPYELFQYAFRTLEQQFGSAHPLIQEGKRVCAEFLHSIKRITPDSSTGSE